jgi:signal transduction histidine kinase
MPPGLQEQMPKMASMIAHLMQAHVTQHARHVTLLHYEEQTQRRMNFLSCLSHEIRTPMNGVLGMLDLIDTTEQNAEQSDYVNTALVAGGHLMKIINVRLAAND